MISFGAKLFSFVPQAEQYSLFGSYAGNKFGYQYKFWWCALQEVVPHEEQCAVVATR